MSRAPSPPEFQGVKESGFPYRRRKPVLHVGSNPTPLTSFERMTGIGIPHLLKISGLSVRSRLRSPVSWSGDGNCGIPR